MRQSKSIQDAFECSTRGHFRLALATAALIVASAGSPAFAQNPPECDPIAEHSNAVVNACTLTLSVGQQHSFNSLTVINGGVVTHPQTSSIPVGRSALELNIATNVMIEAGSSISADGRGSSSGQGIGRGNNSGWPSYQSGGGGYGGAGGDGAADAAGGRTYFGTFTTTITEAIAKPVDLGSGGDNGGAGGGAIKLRVEGTLTVNGRIGADGSPSADGGGGSGGSVWIIAQTLTGAGTITANGGDGAGGTGGNDGGGGGGRISVETADNSAFTTFGDSIEAHGGFGFVRGGAGTIYWPSLTPTNMVWGTVICDNGGHFGDATEFTATAVKDLYANLLVRNQGLVSHAHSDPAGLDLRVRGNVDVESGGLIAADGRGSSSGQGIGRGNNSGWPSYQSGGGGYGGAGGDGAADAAGGRTYFGTFTTTITEAIAMPVDLGSGGDRGGAGGGAIKLRVDGTLTVNGRISADGSPSADGGGGSGGSVWIIAQTLTGAGTITASGGDGAGGTGGSDGGGGGGRISIKTDDDSAFTTFDGSIEAHGGFGFVRGGAGTIYQPSLTPTNMVWGTVICDNGGHFGDATEFTATAVKDLYANLRVRNQGLVSHAYNDLAGLDLRVRGNVDVEFDGLIAADGRGSPSGQGIGRGNNSGWPAFQSGGGGYGGAGGDGADGAQGGTTYGAPDSPVFLGSGGDKGGPGGGRIKLQVDGTLMVDGRVSADGAVPTDGGGGSGGSLWIIAHAMSGHGPVRTDGGAAAAEGLLFDGGGGGGRIRMEIQQSGSYFGDVTACGGAGFGDGLSGTIFEPNSVPKRFSTIRDCNNNGIHDACDIKNGYSLDENEDGIPDECVNWEADDGAWSNAANWDIGLVPNNDDGGEFAPTISGRDARVELDIDVTIDALRVLNDAKLSMTDGDLTLEINGVRNDGVLTIESGRTLRFGLDAAAELTGRGELRLDGFGARLTSPNGVTVTNRSALVGEGEVSAPLYNVAVVGVLRADSTGFLTLTGNSPKRNDGLFEAVDGGTLLIYETTVDGTGRYIADGGEIQLRPDSGVAMVSGQSAEIANGGTLNLWERAKMSVTGNVVLNLCRQTASMLAEALPFESMLLDSAVAGGCTPPKRPSALIERDAILEVGGSMEIRTNARIIVEANLDETVSAGVSVAGDFDNRSRDPYSFDWGCGSLSLQGTEEQRFELASADRGNAPWNFDGNFGIGTLEIGPTATVRFSSRVANTRTVGPCTEALYVDRLIIRNGGTLLLSNGHVYYRERVPGGNVRTDPGGCGQLLQMCTSALPIDRDCDGDADLKEFAAFQRCFGLSCSSCAWADLNENGMVDRGDLSNFISLGHFDDLEP